MQLLHSSPTTSHMQILTSQTASPSQDQEPTINPELAFPNAVCPGQQNHHHQEQRAPPEPESIDPFASRS